MQYPSGQYSGNSGYPASNGASQPYPNQAYDQSGHPPQNASYQPYYSENASYGAPNSSHASNSAYYPQAPGVSSGYYNAPTNFGYHPPQGYPSQNYSSHSGYPAQNYPPYGYPPQQSQQVCSPHIPTHHSSHYVPQPGSYIPPNTASSKKTEEEVAECAVCFEPLFQSRVVYLAVRDPVTKRKTRCIHYYHKDCAESFANSGSSRICPLCRIPFNEIVLVSEDPRQWFQSVDVDQNGVLDQSELLALLMARSDFDWRDLESRVKENWGKWDVDHSGSIDQKEFYEQVLPWINKNVRKKSSKKSGPPKIKASPKQWFEFWDEDHSGYLDKKEVSRALCKSAKLNVEQSVMMKDLVEALWSDFDPDRNGALTYSELFAPNGLMMTVMANFPDA